MPDQLALVADDEIPLTSETSPEEAARLDEKKKKNSKLWCHHRTSTSTHFSKYGKPLHAKHNRRIDI